MEIVGRLTANAVVNTTKNGNKVVNFTIAVNDRYKTKEGETKELATFFSCSYWVNTGVADYMTKGVLAELSGRVSVNQYTNTAGEAKAGLNFHVNNIKLHGRAGKFEGAGKPKIAGTSTAIVSEKDSAEDMPF